MGTRGRLVILATLFVFAAGGCTVSSSSADRVPPSASPASSENAVQTVQITADQAARLKAAMIPLLQVMDHPVPPKEVRVGVLGDSQINAASAGRGQFLVTRGLLEKANDEQLRAVIAHELAHEDLNHVAKAQRLGTGLNIGMILLDQIIPGSRIVAPIAGSLLLNAYTRREEYQADAHGVELLNRARMPGKQMMVNTLTWLQQVEGGSSGGFFATHPATDDRITAVQNLH